MPVLTLRSNVQVDDVAGFVRAFSAFTSQLLRKAEEFVCVDYSVNVTLCVAGTFDPAAVLFVTSLGANPPEEHEYDARALELYRFLRQWLGVPSGRVYIHFEDPGREYMAERHAAVSRQPAAQGTRSPVESLSTPVPPPESRFEPDTASQRESGGSTESGARRRQRGPNLGWFRRSIRRTRPR